MATHGCKLQGRFKGLDADKQQPTACCREDEGKGVRRRRVAPKLIANGELHALERGSPARGLRVGKSRGGEARGAERKEKESTIVRWTKGDE